MSEQSLFIEVVPYDELFLEKSWEWLNDMEVKYFTATPSFSKSDQKAWFERLSEREDYKIWGLSVLGIPIGAFGIKNIDGDSGEYWGYIGEKAYWGIGLGKQIIAQAKSIAQSLGLKRLYLKVLKNNIRAIRLYENTGFITYKQEDTFQLMECRIAPK